LYEIRNVAVAPATLWPRFPERLSRPEVASLPGPVKRFVTLQGSSPKSHLAQAIGRAVIQQGYRVLYREAHILLEEIADATLDGTRKAYFADL